MNGQTRRLQTLITAWPALARRDAVKPVLLDTFSGSGALSSHTPDIYPDGSSWSIINGTFANLSGGYLPYDSGSYGKALINCGLSDFELRWKTKLFNVGSLASGIMFRSNSAGDNFYKIGIYSSAGQGMLITDTAGPIPVDPIQTNGASRMVTMTVGQYYEWRMVLKSNIFRVYDASGALMLAASNAVKTTQTYIGPYCEQPQGNWDFIEVKPVTHKFVTFSVMGDSISSEDSSWHGIAAAKHNNGYCYPLKHANIGAQVAAQMDYYTELSTADNADFTIILLGTNDGTNFTAEYQENLQELWGALHKPIYAMGVLPKTNTSGRATQNGYIEAAVASAQAAGVNVTYWNTDSWIDPATETSDGLHPTSAGDIKIADQVLARL